MFGKYLERRRNIEEALELKEAIDSIKFLYSQREALDKSFAETIDSMSRIEKTLYDMTNGTHIFSDCNVHNVSTELHGVLKFSEIAKKDKRVKELLDMYIVEKLQAEDLAKSCSEIRSLIEIRKNRLFVV